MPVFFAQAASVVAGVLATMGAQLLTERFLKRVIVAALGQIVKRTEADWDDKLLNDAKAAWNVD